MAAGRRVSDAYTRTGVTSCVTGRTHPCRRPCKERVHGRFGALRFCGKQSPIQPGRDAFCAEAEPARRGEPGLPRQRRADVVRVGRVCAGIWAGAGLCVVRGGCMIIAGGTRLTAQLSEAVFSYLFIPLRNPRRGRVWHI